LIDPTRTISLLTFTYLDLTFAIAPALPRQKVGKFFFSASSLFSYAKSNRHEERREVDTTSEDRRFPCVRAFPLTLFRPQPSQPLLAVSQKPCRSSWTPLAPSSQGHPRRQRSPTFPTSPLQISPIPTINLLLLLFPSKQACLSAFCMIPCRRRPDRHRRRSRSLHQLRGNPRTR
jgi:hypothetical protein